MDNESYERLLLDSQKHMSHANRIKTRIIVLLIVLMFLEACFFYAGFVWYESQFDVTTTTTQEVKDNVELKTDGDNANIDYDEVGGNQYNDNAVHNENKGGVE